MAHGTISGVHRGRLMLLGLVVFVIACAVATVVQGKGPACSSFTAQAWAEARADHSAQRFARMNQMARQLEFCDDQLVLGRPRSETRRLLGQPDSEGDFGPPSDSYRIGYRGAYEGDSDYFVLSVAFDRSGRASSVTGAAP